MVDKRSMYVNLKTTMNPSTRKMWLACILMALSGLLGYCAPGRAQAVDPTGHLVLVEHYEDDFSTDKLRYDSYAHSVLWVDGAYPPDSPYLLLSEIDSSDQALVFRDHRDQVAHLVYAFPIAPDAIVRSFPLVLEMELELRFIPDSDPGNQGTGWLCYATSADGIQWSEETCLEPGPVRLNLGLLQESRYVRFEGRNVVVDNLRASIYRATAGENFLWVPDQFPRIQDALDAATDDQTIVVADGEYSGQGNTHLQFPPRKNVTLMSENGPDNCVIDCESLYRGVVFDDQETIGAILDGFTIRNARGSPGSGIYCLNSSPTIISCHLENCKSHGTDQGGQGGGLYCAGGAPLIRDCEFLSNQASSDNHGGRGGAIYLAEDGFAVIERCRMEQNNTADQGGAIYIAGSSPWLEPQQTVEIRNCLISGNTAAAAGGGIILNHNRVKLINCTIADNGAHIGGGVYVGFVDEVSDLTELKNCIIWGNAPENINRAEDINAEGLQITYCDIGEDWTGDGNINADPCFVGDGDYHLLSPAGRWDPASRTWVHDHDIGISPCIDAGSSAHVVGERTPGDQRVNLGFYGQTAQASRGAGTLVYHVDKAGDDRNAGLNRESAVLTIQRAIELASDGDVVLIWPGTYEEEVGFLGKNITVQSAADAATVMAPPGGQGYAFSFFQQEGSRAGTRSILRNLIIRNCPKAAVYCITAAPTLENLTIVENTMGVEAVLPHDIGISSCVFWGNADGDVDKNGLKENMVNYSRLQSPSEDVVGKGNIYSNPLFVDIEEGDFHLQSKYGRFWSEYWPDRELWVVDKADSPCIDTGDPGVFPRSEPHGNGARINMGAYGGTGYASMSSPYNSCDLNQDGYVDFLDFAIFAQNWLVE